MRESLKVLVSWCLLLIASGATPVAAQAEPGQDGPASWGSDVALLVAAMEKNHPDPYHRNSREEWLRAAHALEDQLATSERHEAILGFKRLLALTGDGHTGLRVPARYQVDRRWLPIHTQVFSDGLFLRTAHRDLAEHFGHRIVAVEGKPVDEVFQAIIPYIGYDNLMGALDMFPHGLRDPWTLHAAGITAELADEVVFTFEDEEGDRHDVAIRASTDSWITPEWVDADHDQLRPDPLYREADGNYSLTYLEQEQLVYVYFDSVRDDEGESLAEFSGRLFAFVDEHPTRKLVLDIRENSGGNNYLNQPLLHGLIACDQLNRPGRLFVITGRDTFSAAMCLAVELERHTQALFVGEPPGATPNHFGDSEVFTLPASGLQVRCSLLAWQNSDPRDDRPWISPDLPAELSFSDFFAGRDPALEAVLAYPLPERDLPGPAPNTRWTRTGQRNAGADEAWRDVAALAWLLGEEMAAGAPAAER